MVLGGAFVGAVLAVTASLFPDSTPPAPAPLRTDIALGCHREAAGGELQIVTGEVAVPEPLRSELEAAEREIHERWRSWLGLGDLARAPATLHFMHDAAAFAALYEGPRAADSTATGFYRIRSHEAYILFSPQQSGRARATALHELSHLTTAWHLGPTPAWLNEGLAEYFETLRSGPPVAFLRSPGHLERLLRDGPVPLETLLTLPRRDFASEDTQRRYASAWALIAFLQDHRAGREVLRQVLRDAWALRCEPRSRTSFEGLRAYPGGLEGLETSMNSWIGRHSVLRRS
jgi:hypothetical protein